MKPSLIVMNVPGTPVVLVVTRRGRRVGGGHVTVSAGVGDCVSEDAGNSWPPEHGSWNVRTDCFCRI